MPAVTASSFGTLLRHYRVAAGLTQEELAERAGLSVRGISNLERGVRRLPHKHTLEQLADALSLAREDRARFEDAARTFGGARPPASPRQPAREAPPGPSSPRPLVGRASELAVLARHLAGEGPIGVGRIEGD